MKRWKRNGERAYAPNEPTEAVSSRPRRSIGVGRVLDPTLVREMERRVEDPTYWAQAALAGVVLELLEVLEGVEGGGLVEVDFEEGLAEVVVLGGEHF